MSRPARTRALVVAAHGTASAEGRRAVEECAAAAAADLRTEHAVGYVDVCGPTLEEVLARSTAPVVVPLFLASGYHVRHDVPGAVAVAPDATVTPALGDAAEVVTALADRVLEACGDPGAPPDAVVLTAAGSSVDSARAEVVQVSGLLARRLGTAAGTAYLSGPGPRPQEEVRRLRAAGHRRVVVATHLLAPGHFVERARLAAGELGTVASGPLLGHPALTALVVRRYGEAGTGA
ncbi:sirohydrochlorin chelatase [Ornithinimicrobium pekingense]|uniref:Cobalamin biosynthesis protein CbiX n=1 Tax=Ornithinimicrobium pekingense TaxID=384677 RepID=A0ABQ2F7C6_9MICO|nr:CbiX/SirB N-terminal domain-containing protein [Ornithinimicrobium pekingense]GGK58213.1 cobalamin biosynthesis protein CbiX [Ornithinimicrobium pekingense]